MKKTSIMAALAAAVLAGCGGSGTHGKPASADLFTDTRDGKSYRKVAIGTQIWMAENLNYAAEGSKCYDNKEENCAKYGRLYVWSAAVTACPAGFHLPNNAEWMELARGAGEEKEAGTNLKSAEGWESEGGVPESTDKHGFSALPGGYGSYGVSGDFCCAGSIGRWWSATDWIVALYAGVLEMRHNSERVDWFDIDKAYQFSVRCVQD
jgi:uncharacterized protein (TIGR02145 family)